MMNMNTATEKEEAIISEVVTVVKEQFQLDKIILFGSREKGHASRSSDIDLAIDHDEPSVSELRAVREKIEEVCGMYYVDLVFLPSVDSRFKDIIIDTGYWTGHL
ncbi:MAG: nucleotidyltransferase domain-containing protein [Kiritimatiellae bacterium]|nr:nucleotidyltransferase domain-containing protein [Kiritimatiellia bacterium]